MTAPTFRVTWDGVPQTGGDFASVYAAMAHGQAGFGGNANLSWRLTDPARLWLYDGQTRTQVHIDTVPACDLCPPPIPFLPPVVLKQAVRS
jgi:hypothetical protein